MPARKKHTIEIPSFDTIWKVGALIVGLVFGYIEFEKEMASIRFELDEATTTISELVEKHIESEDKRFEDMEEEIKWYQKNISINPLSWKKKNGDKK